MNILYKNLLKSSCERAISKGKREEKSMFDKSLFQSVSVDNKKKISRQDNIIEHEQLMSIAKNVDINSK